MNRGDIIKSHYILVVTLVFLFSVLVSSASAAEVVLDGNEIVIRGVDDSVGLGGFSIVLSYGSDVSISSVTGLSGFLVVNDTGMRKISGIYGGTEIKTGDIPVAKVSRSEAGVVTISVRELINREGDAIPFSNPVWGGDDVTSPTPSRTEVTTPEQTTSSTSSSGGEGTSTSETGRSKEGISAQETSVSVEHTSVSEVPFSPTPDGTTAQITEKPSTTTTPTPKQQASLSFGGSFVAFGLLVVLKRRINNSGK
ncbi:hypothetical protein E2N92_09105 [Methanofollis formosanus]|uniref:Uncharacterized protein n=1 Tax=Methanofollis formosanus TaxID=299308 RepID=A0A8G1EGW8_9EURY|nr:hypothetical protein [Methanofollis formosanus]QYZ79576.1 hypothetical protein E2N92_09105 [Methanofollis formosanus]